MSLLSTIFGCNKTKNTDSNLSEILRVQNQEEGFNDISLKIIETNKQGETYTYLAKGKFENKIVGLKISIKNNLQAGIKKGEIDGTAFKKDGISFQSIGQESDNFLQAISKIYGIKSNCKFSNKIIKSTIFPLNQSIANLNQPEYYKFKVFFNDDEEENENYAEIFININLEQNFIEFNEKDNEYRANIIKTFSAN